MHKNLYLIIACLFTGFLTIISLKESDSLPDYILPYLDKVFHLFAYITLMLLWSKYAKKLYSKTNINKILSITAILLTIYGIIIEVLQSKLTNTRMLEISDIVANLIGIAFGIIIFKYIIKHELKSNKGLFF